MFKMNIATSKASRNAAAQMESVSFRFFPSTFFAMITIIAMMSSIAKATDKIKTINLEMGLSFPKSVNKLSIAMKIVPPAAFNTAFLPFPAIASIIAKIAINIAKPSRITFARDNSNFAMEKSCPKLKMSPISIARIARRMIAITLRVLSWFQLFMVNASL